MAKTPKQIIKEIAKTTRKGKWGDKVIQVYTTPTKWWHKDHAWIMFGGDLTMNTSIPLSLIPKIYNDIGNDQYEWIQVILKRYVRSVIRSSRRHNREFREETYERLYKLKNGGYP